MSSRIVMLLAYNNNTRPCQTVAQLQCVRPTARSVTRDIRPHDASEGRYWVEKFCLGKNAAQFMLHSSPKQAQLAHPRHVTLQVGTSSIVHKITIGTTATAPNEHVLFMTRPLPPRTTHSKSNTHLWCGFAVPGTLLWYDTPIQNTPSLILSQHHHHHNKFVLIQHHHND